MSIVFEERPSDSAYIESVTHGFTVAAGCPVRPAESHWHMVCTRYDDLTRLLVVGPWSTAGTVHYGVGAEIVWIKFKLGAYLPRRPTHSLLDTETPLRGATARSFWLDDRAWQFPDFESVEGFVERLARHGALRRDPIVAETLEDRPPERLAARTLRHRFLRAAGQTQAHIRQIERAKQAAERLGQGAAILDVVFELGYYDQPHLTRALKQYVGYTPAQIARPSQPAAEPG